VSLLKNRERILLIAILLIGTILRIIFLLEFSATPFYLHPTLDARYYDLMARSVASGRLIQERAFFMGPLYPYIIGLLYKIFGTAPVIPRIFQMALGLGCCLLLYILGRKIFSPSAGLIAAALYALYKPALFYEQTLLSETSMAFFILVFLWIFIKSEEGKNPFQWLVAGFMLGISCLFRGNTLLFAPAIIIWMAVTGYRDSGKIISERTIKQAILFSVGVIAGVAPATLHNYLAERDFILITSNSGFNFFIGNNENASGRFVMPPLVDMDQDPSGRRIAEGVLGRSPLRSSEVSHYWRIRALNFIRKYPARFTKLLFLKCYYFWGRAEIAQIYSMEQMKELMPALRWHLVNFTLVGPLALIALGLFLLKPDRRKMLLLSIIIMYMISLIPFFITARYRIPIIPLLCLVGAYTIELMATWVRERRWKNALIAAGIWTLFIFILNDSGVRMEKEEATQYHNTLGLIYKSEDRITEAIAEYQKSLSIQPTAYALANLATLYHDRKDFMQAIHLYWEAIRLEPDNARMYFNLAQSCLASERFDEARRHFEKAVALDWRVQPLAHYNLALLYLRSGDKKKAQDSMKVYLSLRPDDREAADLFSHLLGKSPVDSTSSPIIP
jgi:tetratricopeptide (TPR) repeat protein